jgi:hypothetical protein
MLLLGVCAIPLAIRSLRVFKQHRILGVLMIILSKMMYDVSLFLVIFLAVRETRPRCPSTRLATSLAAARRDHNPLSCAAMLRVLADLSRLLARVHRGDGGAAVVAVHPVSRLVGASRRPARCARLRLGCHLDSGHPLLVGARTAAARAHRGLVALCGHGAALGIRRRRAGIPRAPAHPVFERSPAACAPLT